MKNLLTLQLWKLTHPYLIIGKIVLLVISSLVFLYLDQIARSLFKGPPNASVKEQLGYVNRAN